MKYFSMFSGIGGFELGIQNAYRKAVGRSEADSQGNQTQGLLPKKGQNINTEGGSASERTSDIINQGSLRHSSESLPKVEQDWEGGDWFVDESESDVHTGYQPPFCVGYSEIDKYAIKVYERQFNGHTNYGDATRISPTELPDFDLLVGGFPCQAFSIAGKRAGFNDTRGTLFFDIARILKEKQPRHLVLENVKGLLSHDSGRTFSTIIRVLTDLGYLVEWQVLNSKDFGVPQNRERVYIVGHLGNECRRKVFPTKEDGRPTVQLQRHISNTLTARYEAAQATGTYIGESERYAQEAEPGRQSVLKEGIVTDNSDIRGGETYPTNPRVRRLTPVECERLQGFPDGWTKYGVGDEPISDTQRYKMCGNAVTVNVVEAIMGGLMNHAQPQSTKQESR